MKRFFKIVGYTAAAFVLLLILLAGLVETPWFKNRLRVMVISLLAPEIRGSLQIGNISGNLLTGVTLDSVLIYDGHTPFVSVGSITLRYDPLPLLRQTVSVSGIVLDRVQVSLIRSRDSVWNVNRIFPSSEGPEGEPSPWAFNIDNLELRNANVVVIDSTTLAGIRPADVVGVTESHTFAVRDINLHASASYHPGDILVDISSAHLHAEFPEFKPLTITGRIHADSGGVTMEHLGIKTAKTDLRLTARLAKTNIFKPLTPELLRDDSTAIRLDAPKIDLAEIAGFFSDSSALQGTLALGLDAAGEFGNLTIRRLNIETPRSVLRIAGKVQNLQRPDDLVINAMIGDSHLDPADLAELFSDGTIPDFRTAGTQDITLQFVGTTNKFTTTVELDGPSGFASVDGRVDLTGGIPSYDLNFAAKGLGLHRIDSTIPVSLLTTQGTLKGRGTGMDDLASSVEMTIDTAVAYGIPLSLSRIAVNAAARRFEGEVAVNSGEMGIAANGVVDLGEPLGPRIEANVRARSVNLARLLTDSTKRSSLTFEAEVNTTGDSFDELNGDVAVTFAPSHYRAAAVDSGSLSVHVEQHDPDAKTLTIRSSHMDADFQGKFDIDILIEYFSRHIPHMVDAIVKHASDRGGEEALPSKEASPVLRRHTPEQEETNLSYTFTFRDLKVIAALIEETPFDAKGTLSGTVSGDADMLNIQSNGAFEHLGIGPDDSSLHFDDFTIDFDVRDIARYRPLNTLGGTLGFSVGNGSISSKPLRTLHMNAAFGNSRGTFTLTGSYDTLYALSLGGSAAIEPFAYALDLDSLRLVSNALSLHNVNDVQARIDSGGIRVMHATMQHHDDVVTLSGGYSDEGEFDVQAMLRKFPLDELNLFQPPAERERGGFGFAGMADADVHLSGTADAPAFTVNATVDSAVYRSSPLGDLSIGIRYAGRRADLDITARAAETDSAPRLSITGYLPVDLAFTDVGRRFPDEPQHLQLHADGFEVGVLQPLLLAPSVEGLSGSITGDVTIAGTPARPAYSGLLTLRSRLLFVPNNIPYVLNGEIVPSGDSLILRNTTLANAPEEKVRGNARVEGGISVKNYNLEGFDLKLYGDLVVMTDASRRSMRTMYGLLFAEMGPGGVTFTGSPDHPYLSGTLLIRDANLTFPPTRLDLATTTSATTLPYVIIDDTSRNVQPQTANPAYRFVANDSTGSDIERVTVQPPNEETFLDRLRYNLTVETRGKTRVRMIFTPATNEELFADLEGKVDVINESGTALAFGSIAVGEESYYNFIKRFTATGDLQFDGQWDNPNMDILAKYEGYKNEAIVDSSADANSNGAQKVIVELKITGTRYEPNLAMGMKVQTDPTREPIDWTSQARGGDVQSDALSFMLTGKFRDELTSADNATLSTVGSSASSTFVTGFTSTFLSDVLTRFLQQEFPFIQSATISYRGSQPDLRISSEVYKGYLRWGGQVLNDIGNANVSYQVSLGEILEARTLRNLFIELSHTVDGAMTEDVRRAQSTNSARVYYKISF